MSGSRSPPSTAVLARVEPDSDENSVPPSTETTESRPGTREISRSTASMARAATPVWNSTSPMATNSGIGARVKLVIEAMALRASWLSPASPPRKTTAPTMLTPKKANATGTPIAISPTSRPSSISSADSQSMAQNLLRRNSSAASASNPPKAASRRPNSMASKAVENGITESSHHSGSTSSLMMIEPMA